MRITPEEMVLTMSELIVLVKHNSDMDRRVYPRRLNQISFNPQGITLEEHPQGYKLLHLPINK